MNLFPNTNFHSLNLDWILSQIRKAVYTVNGQAPDSNGNVNLATVAGVTAVNGVGPDGQGNVQLTPADVGALPTSYQAPVMSVNQKTGYVMLTPADVGALPSTYAAPVDSVNGQTGAVVLDASDVGALPDTYTVPVETVNGQTGNVVLSATDVSALPDTTVIPDRTSQLINDSGFLTAQQAGAVTSVNGKVGAVVLDATDVSALPASTVVPTLTSQLVNDSGFITQAQAAPVQSVNSKVGNVVLDATDVGAAPSAAGIPQGGAAGYVLAKNSGNDYDTAWRGFSNTLWTNPNPTSSFSAQTIDVDASPYSFIVIMWATQAANSADFPGQLTPVDSSTHTHYGQILPPSGNAYMCSRDVTAGSTITFGAGLSKAMPNAARSTDNAYMVPRKIYGLL